jgi:hypothetical protein
VFGARTQPRDQLALDAAVGLDAARVERFGLRIQRFGGSDETLAQQFERGGVGPGKPL